MKQFINLNDMWAAMTIDGGYLFPIDLLGEINSMMCTASEQPEGSDVRSADFYSWLGGDYHVIESEEELEELLDNTNRTADICEPVASWPGMWQITTLNNNAGGPTYYVNNFWAMLHGLPSMQAEVAGTSEIDSVLDDLSNSNTLEHVQPLDQIKTLIAERMGWSACMEDISDDEYVNALKCICADSKKLAQVFQVLN